MSKSEYFYDASYFFERARGRVMDDYELGAIKKAGLDRSDPLELSREIQASIVSGSLSAKERSTACFALGKSFDRMLTPFFQRQLQFEWEAKSCAVYQLMICLSDLDEQVFGEDRNGSYSAMEVELNLRDAEDYLKRAN
jgi:hypothetical protein